MSAEVGLDVERKENVECDSVRIEMEKVEKSPRSSASSTSSEQSTSIQKPKPLLKGSTGTFYVPENEQTSLEFKNVHYEVDLPRPWAERIRCQDSPKDTKVILNGVSGVVRPGEVLGVMGPSGSGKTTLLDFLSGRLSGGRRAGKVLINGEKRGADFKHYAHYVPQEDHLLGTMTVRETIDFSANLTLPSDWNTEKREQMVTDIIAELGLTSCENTKIGTVFQKGLSGGQKRRVSMGVEMISKPRMLFLDEPTSGLDSASAVKVMENIRHFARQGRAVVATIHQPSSHVFSQLDKVLLLSGGEVVYFGTCDNMVGYFSDLGYKCFEFMNPADFVLVLINTDFPDCADCPEFMNPADFVLALINTDFPDCADVESLVAAFKKTSGMEDDAETDEDFDASKSTSQSSGEGVIHDGYERNIFVQVYYLSKRMMKENIRNPGVYWVRLFMYLCLSLMIGGMYYDVSNDQTTVQDRISILFYVVAFMVFMAIAVIPNFIQERAVFERESANGWYSITAYTVSNFITQIPGVFVLALFCTIILVPLIGLQRFDWFLCTLFLSLMVGENFMSFLASLVPYYIIAMAFGAGAFGLFMLCCGFFVLPSNIPDWFIWGYYMAFHTYSFELFMWSEFHDLELSCDKTLPGNACPFPNGDAVLEYYEMDISDAEVRADAGLLVMFALIFRLFFWAVLQVRAWLRHK